MYKILEKADEITDGDRREQYGEPSENFQAIADIWSTILDTEVTKSDVARCMIGLKLRRDVTGPKEDNRVDICGYTKLLDMLEKGIDDVDGKVLVFDDSHVPRIASGGKTTTIRYNPSNKISEGDKVDLVYEDGEPFKTVTIDSIDKMWPEDIVDCDIEGHRGYEDKDEFKSAMSEYYDKIEEMGTAEFMQQPFFLYRW